MKKYSLLFLVKLLGGTVFFGILSIFLIRKFFPNIDPRIPYLLTLLILSFGFLIFSLLVGKPKKKKDF